MFRRVLAAAAAALIVGVASPAFAGAPSTLPPPAPSTLPPAPSTLPPPAPSTLPPPAPRPTSAGASPAAPDPHPQRGGIGPDGEAVGGARLLSRGYVLPTGAARLPRGITARSFVLADLDTGEILAARDPHGRYQPASILKALTCLVLLPRLAPQHTVIAGADAANAEGSAVGLVAGGRYKVDLLFRALLMMSGNDAATALSDAAGGTSVTVRRMNEQARAIGAYDTFVQTPSGLDGWQQLTSAYDMALVLRAIADSPRFLAYDRTARASLPPQHVGARRWGQVPLYNQSQDWFDTVPGALLAKTGFTDAAQHTFLGAAEQHGRRLGVVFLRAQRYPTDQWQQAQALLNWGFARPRAGAAVGVLAPPVTAPTSSSTPTAPSVPPSSTTASSTTASSTTAPSTTTASARPAVSRTALAAGRSPGGRQSVSASLAAGAVTVLVLAVATVLLARRRRRT